MTDTTLNAIQQKVRRLTRSPSDNQLTTYQLNQYINTFVLYDFPEQIRLLNLRTTFTFYTEPYVDVYSTSTDPNSPLYNFINKYISVHPPIYLAGFQGPFFEDREQFFGIYPFVNSIASIGPAGDGSTVTYSGVVNSQQALVPPGTEQQIALLRDNVLFSSVDLNNNGLALIDYPIFASIGNLYVPGGAPTSKITKDPNNYINYVTGAFTITFGTAPAVGQSINSQTVPKMSHFPKHYFFMMGNLP